MLEFFLLCAGALLLVVSFGLALIIYQIIKEFSE